MFGPGLYFTSEQGEANWGYAQTRDQGGETGVYEVYLNITNPVPIDTELSRQQWGELFDKLSLNEQARAAVDHWLDGSHPRTIEQFHEDMVVSIGLNAVNISNSAWINAMKSYGWDGVIKQDPSNSGDGNIYVVAFDSSQAKRVDNENPTGSSDIRFSARKNETTSDSQDERAAKKYSYSDFSDADYYYDGRMYEYDFLVSQDDMTPVELPPINDVLSREKIDRAKVINAGIDNAKEIGSIQADGSVVIENKYTKRKIKVTRAAIRHGLSGNTFHRLATNSRLGSVIGEIVRNSIPINALNNTANDVVGTYAMVAYVTGYGTNKNPQHFIAVTTVEQRENKVGDIKVFDDSHATNGRAIKEENRLAKATEVGVESDPFSNRFSKISISQLINLVNRTHRSILSEDVLKK